MLLTSALRKCVLPILLLTAATLPAQTPTAVVNGTVIDPAGAAVPEATVTVVNQETNVTSQKNTNGDGTFTIINLLPGNYVLTVEKTGFKKVALPVFKLDVNQTLTENITLQVGASTETVTVSADSVGVMVQRASTELGTTIDEQMVHELPLNGRNFTELLILQPGVNPAEYVAGQLIGRTGAGGNPMAATLHSPTPSSTGLGRTALATVRTPSTWTASSTPTTAAAAGPSRPSPTPFRNSRYSRTTTTRSTATCWARWSTS